MAVQYPMGREARSERQTLKGKNCVLIEQARATGVGVFCKEKGITVEYLEVFIPGGRQENGA